jgi:hypothetical protein
MILLYYYYTWGQPLLPGNNAKLTFTQFLLKTIAHTFLLTGVLAVVYPSTIMVMHKRLHHCRMFLRTHL